MAPRLVLSMCLGLLAAGAAAAGCVVCPQPSPPDLILETDRIGSLPNVSLTDFTMGFEAGPGTVNPPEGIVVVTNLDATDAPSIAKVQPDGSFTIGVPGVPGDRFRFQAKNGKARSQPVDVDTGAGDTAESEDTPSCLVLAPARWVALDGPSDARSIVIQNECAEPVTIAAPRLRRGFAGFSFAPTAPLAIAAGAVDTVTVKAGSGAEVEDVLLLDVIAPAPAQRAVTLTVPDP